MDDAAIELMNKRMDWIEETLQNLARIEGLSYVMMGRADHRPDDIPVPQEVVDLVSAGKKMDAVKRYRELTGLGFAEAQAAVSRL
jgi:ribosomal protein L7/L12